MAWFSLAKIALQAGSKIYANKQKTKMAMSDAQLMHAEKMARGEEAYQGKLLEARQNDYKDEFVLIIISAPIQRFRSGASVSHAVLFNLCNGCVTDVTAEAWLWPLPLPLSPQLVSSQLPPQLVSSQLLIRASLEVKLTSNQPSSPSSILLLFSRLLGWTSSSQEIAPLHAIGGLGAPSRAPKLLLPRFGVWATYSVNVVDEPSGFPIQ